MEPSLPDVSGDILLYLQKAGLHLQREATHLKLLLSVPQKAAVRPYWLASLLPLTLSVDLELGTPFETLEMPSVLFQDLQKRQPDLQEVVERSQCEVGLLEAYVENYLNSCQCLSCPAGLDLYFSQVFVSCLGSSHNSHVLEASQLCHRGDAGTLLPAVQKEIGGCHRACPSGWWNVPSVLVVYSSVPPICHP